MASPTKTVGYHRLARLMGQCDELAIFRRFNDLNILNLLSLQAELVELRDDFYSIAADDEKAGMQFSDSFSKLLNSRNTPNDFQYMKLIGIRAKLKEYNDALLQVAQVTRLERAPKKEISQLQEWLRDAKGGKAFLQDSEAFTWTDDYRSDLLTIRQTSTDQDPFTKWLITKPVALYHALIGDAHKSIAGRVIDLESGTVYYSEGKLDQLSKLISTTVASTMPLIAILGLYFEKDMLKRIYMSLGITAAFAASLSLFTDSRRIEIFAATAAMAAVEVVFIGSAQDSSTCPTCPP